MISSSGSAARLHAHALRLQLLMLRATWMARSGPAVAANCQDDLVGLLPVSTYLVASITCSSGAEAMPEIPGHDVGMSLSIPAAPSRFAFGVLLIAKGCLRRRAATTKDRPATSRLPCATGPGVPLRLWGSLL
jgi:hypothetical protein